jgi:hypothetical protein
MWKFQIPITKSQANPNNQFKSETGVGTLMLQLGFGAWKLDIPARRGVATV